MTDTTLERFIDRGDPADFDELAIALVARQLDQGVVGCEPAWTDLFRKAPGDWRAIPPIRPSPRGPLAATAGPEIIAHVMRACWRTLAPPGRTPILLLAPLQESSAAGTLALAIHHAATEDDLTRPVADNRVDTSTVRSWLAARQRGGRPATIVATLELLGRLLRFLDRHRLRFRLPAGSTLMTIEPLREAAEAPRTQCPSVAEHLGLAPPDTRRLVIVPTLTTPLPVKPRSDGSLILMAPGHWLRCRLSRGENPFASKAHRVVIMDLATTQLPACQEIDLEPVARGDRGLVLQS